jgi:hypothetical protein
MIKNDNYLEKNEKKVTELGNIDIVSNVRANFSKGQILCIFTWFINFEKIALTLQ